MSTKDDIEAQVRSQRQHLDVLARIQADPLAQPEETEIDRDDPLGTWLSDDVLEQLTIIDCNGDFVGAELLLCVGGPGIRYDSRWGEITGHWGGETATAYVHSDTRDVIDGFLAEIFRMSNYRVASV